MRKFFAIAFLLLLILPLVCSVEVTIDSTFSRNQLLIARIIGNFEKPILRENIYFYRGHVSTSMEYDITKIQDDYYIYALLSKPAGNYSIVIEDVKYLQAGEMTEDNLEMNFTISDSLADFYVKPGFLSVTENFSLTVQNLKDSNIDIGINVKTEMGQEEVGFWASLFGWVGGGEEQEAALNLKAGQVKTVDFQIYNVSEPTLKFIEFSSGELVYDIPVYLIPTIAKEREMKFIPENLTITMEAGSDSQIRILTISNTGNLDLLNIQLLVSNSLSSYISLNPKEIPLLAKGTNQFVELSFNSTEALDLDGQIIAKTGNLETASDVSLSFVAAYIPPNDTDPQSPSCAEIGGLICSENEQCEGTTENTRDGACCLGRCNPVTSSLKGALIGWGLIILIIVLVGLFFFFRYKKAKGTGLFKK